MEKKVAILCGMTLAVLLIVSTMIIIINPTANSYGAVDFELKTDKLTFTQSHDDPHIADSEQTFHNITIAVHVEGSNLDVALIRLQIIEAIANILSSDPPNVSIPDFSNYLRVVN